ncbi:amino acid/amide ABC transporter membrane protein 1 (HAAT family) [Rhizobium sp. ERR 922]|uniref:branched-chain amino acid ABC transporter permease n=1 Tax=unclassified Rhizobium TaxID=2613769 RepID=UPI0011A9492F|nr:MULTISPECIES: branched-chain amino acid ABC transporter permease [unclassified Rhizobium]TWB53113.1 amino acid/amide ABC transporter membrane protein 1 (HAAT family) [Rhizobium sp. ERR 922]TWB95922.1 amino acid/amide ABC transporter membrane protein 1 (HAAT family) [Rhizobium sp. ERR 942]
MEIWIGLLMQGILLGGLYALFGLGLSLVFGVMRLVNIAHGDLIIQVAYICLLLTQLLGIGPLYSLLLLVPVSAIIGFVLQATIFERTLNKGELPPMLASFGLAIVIQNVLLLVFGADSQKLSVGSLETASLPISPGLDIGVLPLVTFLLAILSIWVLQGLVYRTGFGRLLRAVSDDHSGAGLIGINTKRVYRLAMAIALSVAAIAAVMMAVRMNFDPSAGPSRLIFAFEAVVIGGLGNLWGTLAGGIILGVAQMLGAQVDASWQVLAGHIVFLVVLLLRPQGLFKGVAQA